MKPIGIALARLSTLFVLLMTAPQGLAQAPAPTSADLRQRVSIDQRIRILLADGRRITGSAQEMTDAKLRLRTSSGIENINMVAVRELSVRRNDSIWNGLIAGFGVGALVGLALDQLDDCERCHDSLYYSTALGTAAGVGIDLLFRSTQVLYRAASVPQAKISLGFRTNSTIKMAVVSFGF